MNYAIKKSIRHPVMTWVLLLGMLLLNHCSCRNPAGEANEKDPLPTADEVIVFCGTSGVGKSALSNSIFQANVFPAGPFSTTTKNEEHIYQSRKYINNPLYPDTIGKMFSENNKYKIVFVIILDLGKMQSSDLTKINTVCDAIKAPFEYGIIINKVTKRPKEEIKKQGVRPYFAQDEGSLHKKPASYLIIGRDEDMEDAPNVYLPAESKSRKKLLSFIANLKAFQLGPTDVR